MGLSISFHGAAGMVTGSSYVLSDGSYRMVIDCGMFQGDESMEALNYERLLYNPAEIDGAVLTHAHLDHCGRLPLLTDQGFKGRIHMTQATKSLTELALYDSANIQVHDRDEPLYNASSVDLLFDHVTTETYHQRFAMGPFWVEMYDAGHILGSTSLLITHEPSKHIVAFSGDLGNSPQDIIMPTEFLPRAQTVVMESTYGDKDHVQEDVHALLAREINEIYTTGGVMLIPAFSIERTQELLYILDQIKQEKLIPQDLPVFLDSPMAIRATRVFKKYTHLMNERIQAHARVDDPFDFPGLHVVMKSQDSKRIHKHIGPKVIIAGSGMMTGGRIMHHAAMYLPLPSTTLLFVGYQAEGSKGRLIQDGHAEVEMDGKFVPVRAKIADVSALSSHAGQSQLIRWLKEIKGASTVFLTHGDEPQRTILAEKISTVSNLSPQLPTLHQQLGF